MNRIAGLAAGTLCCLPAMAQAPAVSFSADITPQVRFDGEGKTRFRLYDDTGELSRVRMNLAFDNGLQMRYFQKLARVDNDPDDSGTEEFYLEDPNRWSVGKRYVPFGSNRLLREPAIGASAKVFLPIADIPLQIAAFDNGPGEQRGLAGRLGENPGVSFFVGEHFGIAATSLTPLRFPEEAPGEGKGYRRALGADYTLASGGWQAVFEYVSLRRPHNAEDPPLDVASLLVSYQFPYGPLVLMEVAVASAEPRSSIRWSAQIPIEKNLFLVPSLRLMSTDGWRAALSVRIRL
jgi:hypothetical protein